jgi:hypothetical protein
VRVIREKQEVRTDEEAEKILSQGEFNDKLRECLKEENRT